MRDVGSYLDRIGHAGPLAPTPEVLRALHRAHLFAVPFENLDIHLGRPIVLEEPRLVDKIVAHRRGGFCYELNGAFAWLLAALGFRVDRLAAGVWGGGRFGPPFDHLLLRVSIPPDGDEWIADVGFGDGFVDPLRWEVSAAQPQDGGTYRIDPVGDAFVLTRSRSGGEPEPQYRFTPDAHGLGAFADMCRFHQTSSASHFTRQRVCSLAKPEGRVTLSEHALIVTDHGSRRIHRLPDDAAYRSALRETFGIEITGPWVPPLPAG
jgi:N-hydroxyarylamine O-acetyltransferase